MKSYRDRKNEEQKKINHKIWSFLNIEKAIKKFGFPSVKLSLNKWIKYQQENSRLLKDKRILEGKLSEINNKL